MVPEIWTTVVKSTCGCGVRYDNLDPHALQLGCGLDSISTEIKSHAQLIRRPSTLVHKSCENDLKYCCAVTTLPRGRG